MISAKQAKPSLSIPALECSTAKTATHLVRPVQALLPTSAKAVQMDSSSDSTGPALLATEKKSSSSTRSTADTAILSAKLARPVRITAPRAGLKRSCIRTAHVDLVSLRGFIRTYQGRFPNVYRAIRLV